MRVIAALILFLLLNACGGDLRRAEKLYLQAQTVNPEVNNAFADPLGEAIGILESYLSRNHDEPAGTLLLWRCYLRAAHPRAQAMYETMRRMPERMRELLPDEIRREPDKQMRERMVYLLGEIATEQEVAPLIKILEQDQQTGVQRAAAEVLGRIGNADAIPPLLRKLGAEQSAVRYYACRALSSFPQSEVCEALLACLQNTIEAEEVRHQAAQSLATIGRAEFNGQSALLQQLERLLQNQSQPASTRLLAASTLAALGHHSGFDLAMASAHSDDVYLRGLAIITLGYIGDEKALPFLTDALQNGNKALRLHAAEALGRLGDMKALPNLYKALDDTNEAVREAARQSINKIKAQGTHK